MTTLKRFALPATLLFSSLTAMTAAAQQTSLEVSGQKLVVPGPGELELAVSGDGKDVLLTVNGVRSLDLPPNRDRLFRLDGGAFVPSNVPHAMIKARDPSLAWTGYGKAAGGKFYFATMGSTTDALIAASIHGNTFAFTVHGMANDKSVRPARCVPAGNCETDQPHLAGDRRNDQDQIYIAWRNKFPKDDSGHFYSMVGCSKDGGQHWLRRSVEHYLPKSQRRGDFPRVTVGPDGYLYVISATSRTDADLQLQRFSPCSDGFHPYWTDSSGRSAPSRIGHFKGVRCESQDHTIPGLDRCNVGNILASPTVSVDDTNAKRVFVVYADESSPGNHDIVILSTDDVTSLARDEEFPDRQTIDKEWRGERYLPWSCTTQGRTYAGWYDRRSQTSLFNDNTEYFVGSPGLTEVPVSDVIDRQCASGWPGGGGRNEAEGCSQQPQPAGFCLPCPNGSMVDDGCSATPHASTPRCDYSTGGCPAGLGCVAPAKNKGRGKFGDYNGIACNEGRVYVAWAAAVAPSVLPPVCALSVFYANVDPVTTPSPPPPSPECQDCKADRDSCLHDDPSETRVCVQIFNACRRKHHCR